MAIVPQDSAMDAGRATEPGGHVDAPELRLFVMGLFFIFGGITSLNDVIIPKLKELFTLDHATAMLVPTCSREVCSAASSNGRNGSCASSPVQHPS